MADDELKVSGFRKWHDVQLQQGGAVREITKVRFFLGTHGPFEHTFDRNVEDRVIDDAIRAERRSLEAHGRV